MNEQEASSPELSVFLGLACQEPEWRHVTIDHADERLGAFLVTGGQPRVVACANHFMAEEVHLPGPVTHGFVVPPEEEQARSLRWLEWTRQVRAERAREYLARLDERTVDPVAVDWPQALQEEGPPRHSDTSAAAELLVRLHASDPGSWALSRVTRCTSGGGLWAFGMTTTGDLVLCSHDVEARRTSQPPSTLWLPRAGRLALELFLDVDPTLGAVDLHAGAASQDVARGHGAQRAELATTLRKLSRTLGDAVRLVKTALERVGRGPTS